MFDKDIRSWINRNYSWWCVVHRWFRVTFGLKHPALLNADHSCILCGRKSTTLLYRRVPMPIFVETERLWKLSYHIKLGFCSRCSACIDAYDLNDEIIERNRSGCRVTRQFEAEFAHF